MTKTTKTTAITVNTDSAVIVQFGWQRLLIDRKNVQSLFNIFADAKVIERDYAHEKSYSYISGSAVVEVSTVNEAIEAFKRPEPVKVVDEEIKDAA